MKYIWFVLLVIAAPCVSSAGELEKIKIKVGGKPLTVEVAKDWKDQERGLMFRKSMPENHGMLFVFDSEKIRKFWMKNTFIPLSIGYFSDSKQLINVVDMEPVTSELVVDLPNYESTRPARYALEVNKGWFKRNGIKPGAKIEIP